MFTFEYLTSLYLVGPTQTTYTITVTGSVGYGDTVKYDEASFLLRMLNPCNDPSFV